MKIAILINDTTYAYLLRREIIQRLVADKHAVYIVGEVLLFKKELKDLGCHIVGLKIGRHDTNPMDDFRLNSEKAQTRRGTHL